MNGALAGLRVIDCSRLIAGGVLSTVLADHGAGVIKVENPRGGDPRRTWLRERGEHWWKVYPVLGSVRMTAPTPRLSDTPAAIRWAGPALGAHNREVYAALGIDAGELAELERDGVV